MNILFSAIKVTRDSESQLQTIFSPAL